MNPATLLFLVTAALLAGCHRSAEASDDRPAAGPATKVRVATVQLENLPEMIEVTGTVHPRQRAQLAAKVMGTIKEMPVSLGQAVHAGDVLVEISAGEISPRVVQAQSQLNAAKRDLDRERDLLAKSASTADMVKGLEDRLSAAQAMVREAEAMLSYATVRAPFDGVVARKLANSGDFASPGNPLLELEGTSDFQVEAAVPDSLSDHLAPGAAMRVEVPSEAVTFAGSLAELSSAADPNAHTVLAKIRIPSEIKVRSGEFARVSIPGAPVGALTVPSAVVSRVGQMERVFVVANDGRSTLRLVKTGAHRDDRVEILAGLDARERVVIAPPTGLVEGQLLEIIP